METKVISVTTGIGPTEGLSPEELIVYAARVSNPANQMNSETSPKLIDFLIKNKHWSPFEMVDMTVEIKTSRAIAQQILRHRSFSFQEFSQRYAAVTEMEPVQIRKQADKNRQSSLEAFDPILPGTIDMTASRMIADHVLSGQDLYKSLLESGVAKECARMVLPLTTQTTIYMKGSARSWIHYLQIRCDPHTQLEHREIGSSIQGHFTEVFPNISSVLWTA